MDCKSDRRQRHMAAPPGLRRMNLSESNVTVVSCTSRVWKYVNKEAVTPCWNSLYVVVTTVHAAGRTSKICRLRLKEAGWTI
jgi:hypothetical protein